MAVRQTIVCKDLNNTYKNLEDISIALKRTSTSATYSSHLDNWRTKFNDDFYFDVDSQQFTMIRNWKNNEDYETYKTSVPDRDSIFSSFESAGWSINVQVEYI